VKNKAINQGKPSQEKPVPESLEMEIEDLIEREKTRRRIVGKLLSRGTPPSSSKPEH
jgi:hypothetical protein